MAQAPSTRPVTIDLSGRRRETFESVFFRWAINVGKTIIVVVELVALGALFYRFVIDRQLVDQRDAIEQQAFLVQAQQDKEREFLSIIERTEAVAGSQASTESVFEVVTRIRESIDTGYFESGEIVVNQDTILFQGRAFAIFDVQNFVNELSENPRVSSISIDEINSTTSGIRFSLTIKLLETERIF